ncbi:MAG: hypothetical protein ACOWWR_13415 [Eubacteriales bacterium]
MENDVLVYDRDWETIKGTLDFIPEDQRETFLLLMVKTAVYQ